MTNGKADNHEGIDFYKPVENPDKTKPLWGENQWPDIPGFKEKYDQWVEKMKKLGLIVMEAYVFPLLCIELSRCCRLNSRWELEWPTAWV